MTDRELLEKLALNSKAAAEASQWTKNYIIVTSIVALILFILSALS